jgi:hypothetical protein
MANNNVVIVSCPRSGTHKLGMFFSENGYFYMREAYTHLYESTKYSNANPWAPNQAIDNWMINMINTSPVPVCIKVFLHQLYNRNTRITIADRKLLGVHFPVTIYLYRKSGLDVATSQALANIKGVWSNNNNLKDDFIYNSPVNISIQDIETALKNIYNNWQELLALNFYSSEREAWITYEDDVLLLNTKSNEIMPDKKNIIANWKELETYYNNKWVDKFNNLTNYIMDKRSNTISLWRDILNKKI